MLDRASAPLPAPTARDLTRFARRPIGFMLHYVGRRRVAHAAILLSVVLGVACSVSASFASKLLVNALQAGAEHHHGGATRIWTAVVILLVLITVDNLSWRVGGWISTRTFVEVTGDLRRDLFQHLTGHSPSYFADRMPGTLAGRITNVAGSFTPGSNLIEPRDQSLAGFNHVPPPGVILQVIRQGNTQVIRIEPPQ